MKQNTDWLRKAGWGVMFHYLAMPASDRKPSPLSAADWQRHVDSFDVALFARQIQDIGAGYVIFTLGQNSGHFCAPNAVYDELTGLRPSLLSQRDLVSEIADALSPAVKVIAYLPSHAPALHEEAAIALRCTPPWNAENWGFKRTLPGAENTDERLTEFQRNWESVIRHWGESWGERVAGWWIDGCYFAERLYGGAVEPNFHTLAQALRAGYPERIVAFNSGKTLEVLSDEQDYTAGEMANLFPVHYTRWGALSPVMNNCQLHLLSFLGSHWGADEPRFSTEFVKGYTHHINEHGGALTWDIPISYQGKIPESFLRLFDGLRGS
jgi:hypothetical protein